MSGWARCVEARVVERWVVNFRLPVGTAAAMVPVPWLVPRLVDGHAIFSYCPYVLDTVRIAGAPVWPRPIVFAAGRVTVCHRDDPQTSIAWVCGREGGHPAVGPLGRAVLALPFRRVEARRTSEPDRTHLALRCGRDTLFTAAFAPSPCAPDAPDALLATADEFEGYFTCRASWSPAGRPRTPGGIAGLSLDGVGTTWSRIDAQAVGGTAVPGDAILDSAYRGVGGTYRWTVGDTWNG